MSRSLANQLHIALSSTHIALVYRTGITQRILAQKHISLAADELDLQTLIKGLESGLQSIQFAPHSTLHVTLGSDWVRYLSLPAQATTIMQAEKLAYAKAAFREIYGNVVSDWRVQCHDAPPNQPTLAAAIDEALTDALHTVATQHKLKLTSLQPSLIRALNRLAKQIGKSDALFVMVEDTRLLLVQLNKGYCQQIRSHQRTESWPERLNDLLSREALLGEYQQHAVLLYAPSEKNVAVSLKHPWALTRIGLTKTDLNANYSLLEVAL